MGGAAVSAHLQLPSEQRDAATMSVVLVVAGELILPGLPLLLVAVRTLVCIMRPEAGEWWT